MQMDKVATAGSYAMAGANVANGFLNYFTPEQWSAVGVLAGILFGLLTYLTNVYFKNKEFQRNGGVSEHKKQSD